MRRRSSRGISLAGSIEIPAIGVRFWSRELFGPDASASSVKLLTGGPSFQEIKVHVEPNRDRVLGLALYAVGRNRTDDRFYGIVTEYPADASVDELKRRVHLAFVEAGTSLRFRPGGAAGRWRFSAGGGGAYRRYLKADSVEAVMLEDLPATDTRHVIGALWVEHLARWDPSRRRLALDAAVGAEPAWGVAGYHARWVNFHARAALGMPLGEGTTLLLRARAVAQESYGQDAVGFWDVPEVGGDLHRGFSEGRFRGPTTAVAAVDVRWPIRLRLDGFAFFEYGGAFAERFQDFGPHRMRPGMGVGLRVYRMHGLLLRTFVAWGIGDGPRVGLSFDAAR